MVETWSEFVDFVKSIREKGGENDPWSLELQNKHELFYEWLGGFYPDQGEEINLVTRQVIESDMNTSPEKGDMYYGLNNVVEFYRICIKTEVQSTMLNVDVSDTRSAMTWVDSTIVYFQDLCYHIPESLKIEVAINAVKQDFRVPLKDYDDKQVATNVFLIYQYLILGLQKIKVWLDKMVDTSVADLEDRKLVKDLPQSINLLETELNLQPREFLTDNEPQLRAIPATTLRTALKPTKRKSEASVTDDDLKRYKEYISNCVKWLSGRDKNGRIVIQEKDSNLLKGYLIEFLNDPQKYNGLNKPNKRIKTRWTNQNLSATFHRLHLDIGAGVIPKRNWVYFLHSVFIDFDNRRTSGEIKKWTTYKKFSVPDSNDEDLFTNLDFTTPN